MRKTLLLLFTITTTAALSQETTQTFNSTRIINGHSVETLGKRVLEYRIEHRFGDFAGENGGIQTAFGFDNAADIRFALEYGLTKNTMIGVGRSKGNGFPYRSLIDGFFKYKVLTQNKAKGIPVSVALLQTMSLTYMKRVDDISQVAYFPEFYHRLAYCSQVIIARKLNERGSISINPTYVHRNYVSADDQNGLFAVGIGLNLKITKSLGLLAEYYHVFDDPDKRLDRKNSMALGVEYQTNGHNFHFVLANATGFGETQFITNTNTNPFIGQFRIGFSITRKYKL